MNPPSAPMKPPNGLGRGVIGDGETTGLGLAGCGAAGAGFAGATVEREPRLPLLVPPPARAQADSICRIENDAMIASVRTMSRRLFMSPSCVGPLGCSPSDSRVKLIWKLAPG